MEKNNSIYRFVKATERLPEGVNVCYRDIWESPYKEGHKEWIYFNGATDENGRVYDVDGGVIPDQDTVEWLEEITVSADQQELFRKIQIELRDYINDKYDHRIPDEVFKELSSKYLLIKR